MTKVYLAGGMRSGWQDTLAHLLRNHFQDNVSRLYYEADLLDPRYKGDYEEGSMSLELYGAWDLHQIRQCDIVFGYMESDNPSGIGMACELGYAYGLGKTVITVIEPGNLHQKDRYIQFMKKVSHFSFETFDEGIKLLKSLLHQKQERFHE